MDVRFTPQALTDLTRIDTDALVVLWPDAGCAGDPVAAKQPLVRWVKQAVDAKVLMPGVGKCAQSLGGSLAKAKQVVVVGVGSGAAADVRKACLAAFGLVRASECSSVHLYLGLLPRCTQQEVRVATLAAAEATYEFTTTKPSAKGRVLKQLHLAHPSLDAGDRWALESVAWCRGIELAKEWANRPANHATPVLLAEAASKLGAYRNISVEVLGHKEVAKLGMGAFLAVAQGSEQPLRFIVVQYTGAGKGVAPVVLVGKGITFDTGGISIKPAAEMDEMKFDMSGAASVLGTLEAIGRLQPLINVVGLIPACENMPDGRAVKPGDVVTSMSGQSIEILNTDAEGRLVLCDALSYAKRFKPDHIIDVATLTGACVIALGHTRTGLFSNDADLSERLLKAGEAVQDPAWALPLDDEYAEGLKSNFADVANVAGRPGGAVSAAKFLQKFVPDQKWAHLDIAGTAWRSGSSKGATGRPVALLLAHLLSCANPEAPSKKKRKVAARA